MRFDCRSRTLPSSSISHFEVCRGCGGGDGASGVVVVMVILVEEVVSVIMLMATANGSFCACFSQVAPQLRTS